MRIRWLLAALKVRKAGCRYRRSAGDHGAVMPIRIEMIGFAHRHASPHLLLGGRSVLTTGRGRHSAAVTNRSEQGARPPNDPATTPTPRVHRGRRARAQPHAGTLVSQ